jgi:hypothetical protein
MPADVSVSNHGEMFLEIERQRVPLSPSEGFALAERLIRGATRAIVTDEADRALVREVVDGATHAQ